MSSQEGKIILMILMLQFVIMGAYVAKNDKSIRDNILKIEKELK